MRTSLAVLSCFLLSAWLAPASAQEGGAPGGKAPAGQDFQRSIDEAVDRRLKELGIDGKEAGTPEDWRKCLPFDLHGGAYLWHYEPLMDGAKSNSELYDAWLMLDAQAGDFGFHFEPRFRDSKLRPYYNSNVWVQEVYGSMKLPAEIGTLKAGKEYSRFGHFWDDSFFGNQPYFDGIVLDPDMGLSLEGSRKLECEPALDFTYALQFFPNDALTNGSLQDRDTISVSGARQRNICVARLAPKYCFNDDLSVLVGGSAQRFEADFAAPTPNDTVRRFALETEITAGPVSAFAEVIQQHGMSVTDFPIAGDPSDDVDYFWGGIKYTWKTLSVRFNYSTARYKDSDVRETTWLPGLTWAVDEHVALLLEYDAWRRSAPAGDSSLDRSFNLILALYF